MFGTRNKTFDNRFIKYEVLLTELCESPLMSKSQRDQTPAHEKMYLGIILKNLIFSLAVEQVEEKNSCSHDYNLAASWLCRYL